MADSKRCSRCERQLPPESFGKNGGRPDGLQDHCRECRKAWYRANSEKVRAAVRANYSATPPDVRAARSRQYREANRDKLLAYSRERYYANRDADVVRRRLLYEANREAEKQARRDWYWSDPEARRTRAREYYEQNAERCKSNSRKWAAANRERRDASNEARRARKLGGAVVEIVNRKVVLERGAGICGICGEPVDPDRFHVDHIIPLSRGGEESYANTQPTHPRCNLRKQARLDYEGNCSRAASVM